MKVQNKHLMFRAFPDTPETVIDAVLRIYSGSEMSIDRMTKKVIDQSGAYITKKQVKEICSFARKYCEVKAWSQPKPEEPLGIMRFFKNGKKFKEVRMS